MGALRSTLAAALLLAAAPLRADEVGHWRPLVAEASERFGVPAGWIERVMRAESGGRTRLDGRSIRSAKGAIGLMQLMPGTWSDMRARLSLGRDPDDPRDNIMAGTFYLRQLYDRFGYPGLFAAYNAGPARYEQYLAGRPLPAETRAYLAGMGIAPGRVAAPERQTLFLVRRDRADGPEDGDTAPPVDPLFAVGTDAD